MMRPRMAGVAQLEWRRCKDNRAEENKTGEGADRNGNENQLVYQKDQSGLTDNTTTGGQKGPGLGKPIYRSSA